MHIHRNAYFYGLMEARKTSVPGHPINCDHMISSQKVRSITSWRVPSNRIKLCKFFPVCYKSDCGFPGPM